METDEKAVEKQTPKKIRIDNEGWVCCPNCGDTFYLFNYFGERNKYCGRCSQTLDWSNIKKEGAK